MTQTKINQPIFYIYAYYDPDTDIPFYVGKGHGRRHLSHLREVRNGTNKKNHKIHKIKKMINEGKDPIIRFLEENLSHEESIIREKYWIAHFGRIDLETGSLCNMTEGGDGRVQWSKSERDKISKLNTGKISVKDKDGNRFQVEKDDPRWVSGELVGVATGHSSNSTGKLTGYIMAKDKDGNRYRVKKDDPRWISGELVGLMKGTKPHPNIIKAAQERKGFKRSRESVEQGAAKLRGIPKSEEHKKKLSEATRNFFKNKRS